MTINCPLYCLTTQYHSSHGGPHDSLIQNDDTTYCASFSCPDLDPSSFMDSLQTHDSLITPESPQSPYAPSPSDSLDEGIMQVRQTQDITQVNPSLTQVHPSDSLAYNSLITALLRLSLEP